MRFDSAFLDELKNRLSIAAIIGRRVKLVRSGKDWKGCCPFHGEKTPSFYIYEDHYHCFGCGAHGDAISFVHQTQGGTFTDTIERLAGEAGLSLPAPDPHIEEKREVRRKLSDVLEAARLYYQAQLYSPQAQPVRDYLAQRGISRETAERFSFGWAEAGNGVVAHLEGQGFSKAQMKETGLLRESQTKGEGRPFFFNRLMIPIFGRKKEVLSFGGRVLDDSKPKYLNGPETPLFSKKHVLFNFEQARNFIDQKTPILVVEGYMDVIALSQQGIGGAVAPLGTSVTEDQLRLLWRCSDAPVFCFDGDNAGRRAALRVCEVAFPLLETGKRLSFCFLPQDEDPDSLVRQEGRENFWKRIETAHSLEESYFWLLSDKTALDGPDGRAALRKALTEASDRIKDRILGGEYRAAWMDRFFKHFRFSGHFKKKDGFSQKWQNTPQNGFFGAGHVWGGNSDEKRLSFEKSRTLRSRYQILFGILMCHPEIFPFVEEAFSRLDFGGNERLIALREMMLEWHEDPPGNEAETLSENLRQFLSENGFSEEAEAFSKLGEMDTEDAPVEASWWHFYGFLDIKSFEESVRRDIAKELSDATAPNAEEGAGEIPERTFSKALLARIEVRDRLRRGEMPESVSGGNLSLPP